MGEHELLWQQYGLKTKGHEMRTTDILVCLVTSLCYVGNIGLH
jgi:hypothetical protein